MIYFFQVVLSFLFFSSTLVLSTNKDEESEDLVFKRKINNVENRENNKEKRFKNDKPDANLGSAPWFQEYDFNTLSNKINEYFDAAKNDNNYLLQKVKEFENFCINELYGFSDACIDIEIINDIMNGSFISTYNMLIKALTGERGGKRYAKIPNSEATLTKLVYLKNICSAEEFYSVIKNLSGIYRHPGLKQRIQWTQKPTHTALTLEQALSYIIYLKNGHYMANISLIREKSQKEGNKVLPHFLRDKLPINNNNLQIQPVNLPVPQQPLIVQNPEGYHPNNHGVHPPFPQQIQNAGPVNNNYGYQPPIPQPIQNIGPVNNNYGYQPPIPQPIQNIGPVNINYGYQPPILQPMQHAGQANINNGSQLPVPQGGQNIGQINNNLHPHQIPQQPAAVFKRQIKGPEEKPKPAQRKQVDILDNYLQEFNQHLMQQINLPQPQPEERNQPYGHAVPGLEKGPHLEEKDQEESNASSHGSYIPSFRTTQEIRKFYNIESNSTVSAENLAEAKKYAKKLRENLLPNNFPINVLYLKRPKIKETPLVKFCENIDDWAYLDKNMRFYIAIRNKAKELNIQNLLTEEEFKRVERNMSDAQYVLFNRAQIISKVKEMIRTDQFKCYFFNNNLAAIHIENGYLTSKNIYQGYVDRDGTPNYDGVQIEERLNTYDAIYSQAYNLAVELGEPKVLSFFKTFSSSQCLDARIYPLQVLLSEMQRDKELAISAQNAGSELTKLEAFDSKFLEEYRKGIEQWEIIENMKAFFRNKSFNNEIVNSLEIVNFVNEKYSQLGL